MNHCSRLGGLRMQDDKLFRIKKKEGAHMNEKIKEDGSRAALQFNENNELLGPVDLIEVDKSEYTKEVIVEVEKKIGLLEKH